MPFTKLSRLLARSLKKKRLSSKVLIFLSTFYDLAAYIECLQRGLSRAITRSMGLIFHNGNNESFAAYTGKKAWNNDIFIADGGRFKKFNTEATIRKILTNAISKTKVAFPGGGSDDLKNAIAPESEKNIYVLKGLHQVGNGFVATPHISVGYEDYILHCNLIEDKKHGFIVLGVSVGEERWKDGDGFGTK